MNAPQIMPGKRINAPAPSPTAGLILQRACACGQHTGSGECAGCKKKRQALQRTAVNDERLAPDVAQGAAPPIVHEVLRSPGQPLEAGTRAPMEAHFGRDLSGVKVHTDAKAAESARAVDALAYTVGPHVVFGAGRYEPATPQGQQLLAHEMTHVVQQSLGAGAPANHITVGPLDDRYEQEAGRVAGRFFPGGGTGGVSGSGVSGSGAPLGLQRQSHTPGPVQPFPSRTGPPGVNLEKWSPDVESAYRRAGWLDAAAAVRRCRTEGICGQILTEAEAWRIYQTGRLEAGMEPDPASGPQQASAAGAPLAAGTLASPALRSGGAAAARTAVERAAVRWGSAAVIEGGLGTATTSGATAATGGAAATGTAAATATVAVPVAVGVILVVAIVDLIGWTSFQRELQRQGFVILPNPLGVCIGLCHQPSRPAAPDFGDFPFPTTPPRFDDEALERWIRESARTGPRAGPAQGPQTGPTAVPRPDPAERRRRRRGRCTVQEAPPLGGNAEHDALARHVTGQPVEYIVSTGFFSARYDGMDSIETLYEIKTRHDFLNLLDQPSQRLGPGGRRVFEQAVPGLIEQIENQQMVAALCDYEYRIATNNLRAVEILRSLAPGVPVEYVHFPWPQ